MTKEEIISKYRRHSNAETTWLFEKDVILAMDEWAGYLISNSSSVTTTLEVPKHILDEYSKQQSVAFADWLIKEGYYPAKEDYGRWKNIKTKYTVTWPTWEVYNRFIEQQSKL